MFLVLTSLVNQTLVKCNNVVYNLDSLDVVLACESVQQSVQFVLGPTDIHYQLIQAAG